MVLQPGLHAHPSGALWSPDHRLLFIADLHLGYGFAQRRRGQLGPLLDDQTARKMDAVLNALQPAKVVLLGDTVHAPSPIDVEREWVMTQFARWSQQTEFVFVRGNHDRALTFDFNFPTQPQWRSCGVVAVHGDQAWPEPEAHEVLLLGHLHPAVGVEDAAGVRQRIRVFLSSPQLVILPAFSPFAAGVDVWRQKPACLANLEFDAVAATGTRAVHLGPLSRLVSPAQGTSPKDYQRLRYRRT